MTALELTRAPAASSGLVIETERLILRAPALQDAPRVAALANNRKIAEMTSRLPHPYGLSDAEQWIASSAAAVGAVLAIFAKDEAEAFVGVCGCEEIAAACGPSYAAETAPELGYWVGEPYWGRGYATEAARALIDYLFTATPASAIAASCRVDNPASRHVLAKCGFQWVGAGLCRIRAIGASAPSDRFRLERRTWASLRRWGEAPLPRIVPAG